MSFALLNAFSFIKDQVVDDDTGDRLSHLVTVTILVMSAVLVSTKQLVGSPISCWIPAHYTGNHQKYAENYCWIRNTYRLAYEDHVPREGEVPPGDQVMYYQWMPLILLMQALLFYMPRMVWASLQRRSGLSVRHIITDAKVLKDASNGDKHKDKMSGIVSKFHRVVEHEKRGKRPITCSLKSLVTKTCCRMCGRGHGNYLLLAYLSVKVLYLANVVGQFFLLDIVLGFPFSRMGVDVGRRLANGQDWTGDVDTPFPRVTMCDLKIRRVGNIHRYSVQCVLPINLFTERLYIFLWGWFILVALVTLIETLTWVKRAMFSTQRHAYVNKHLGLSINNPVVRKSRDLGDTFADRYLHPDGVFILRLVARNTNTVICQRLFEKIFIRYLDWKKDHPDDGHGEDEEVDNGYDATLPMHDMKGNKVSRA